MMGHIKDNLKKRIKDNIGKMVEPLSEDLHRECDFFLDKDEDPLNRLGFGMVSYFTIVRNFAILFFVLSLISYPLVLTRVCDPDFNSLATDEEHG